MARICPTLFRRYRHVCRVNRGGDQGACRDWRRTDCEDVPAGALQEFTSQSQAVRAGEQSGLPGMHHLRLYGAVPRRLGLRRLAVSRLSGKCAGAGLDHPGPGWLQTDIDNLKRVQNEKNYRFDVIELGGSLSKADRINRLMPVFSVSSAC